MTCYQRHLTWLFETLDLDYDKANRARVDDAVREVLDLGADTHCPDIWAAIKALSEDEREALPERVGALL